MAQQQMPAAVDRVQQATPPTPPSTSRSSRWAISRGRLLMLLAVFLPALASILAPVLTGDVSYQIRAGELMLEAVEIIDSDPFTFTVFGEPWVNQQWGASIALALVYDSAGWVRLLLMRAVLIGLAFGFVYTACRATEASQIVSSLVTLVAFVVAATGRHVRGRRRPPRPAITLLVMCRGTRPAGS